MGNASKAAVEGKDFFELRFPKPSLTMRFTGWLIGRRSSELDDPVELHENVPHRAAPQDAPMPKSFNSDFDVKRWTVEGQKVVTLHPKSGKSERHIIYFHGGGFFLPMFKEHWPLVGALAETLGVSVTVPLYHVVPEHDYRPATALAEAVYDKVAEEHEHSKIVLAGDSAGGNFAVSLALKRRDAGQPQPGRLILFAPWLDLTLADPAARDVEERDVMLGVDSLQVLGEWWAGDRDPIDPYCSPFYANPAGLPPTAIFQGRDDIFVVDNRSFAAKAAEAGVSVKLYEYEGAPHVFMAVTRTREAKDTFTLVDRFLKQAH